MKNITPWFLLLSLVVGMPAFALAQETETTDTSAVNIETTSAPINTRIVKPTEGTLPEKHPRPQPKQGMKSILEKRMENSTSVRPTLPPKIREVTKEHMLQASGTRPFASGTPKMIERMKLLKDGKMDRKMEAAKQFIRNSADRMGNAIERLRKILSRLDGAIVKMKEKGIDTSNAETLLATAKTKIGDAETALKNTLNAIEAAKPTTSGEEQEINENTRKAVKDAMQKTTEAIKAAHKALVEALGALKATNGVGSTNSSNPGSTDAE
jgi:hypothetical protein